MTPSNLSAPTITLKNGQVCEGRMAVAQYNLLQLYFNYHPEHFAGLRLLAAGSAGEVKDKIKEDLRKAGLVTSQYEVRPLISSLLESAYRMTAEGPVFTSPFAGQSETDRKFLQQCEEKQSQMQKQLLREITQPDSRPSDKTPRGEERSF